MGPEVVFVGHTAYGTDINKEGVLYNSLAGGGLSPAIAASSVLSADRVGLVTVVGDDDFGERAQTYIHQKGFNSEGLEIVHGEKTTWVVIVETSQGRRMAVDAGVSRKFVPKIPDSYKTAQYAHIGSGPSLQQLEWYHIIRKEFSKQTRISADPLDAFILLHPDATRSLLEQVDLIFINEEEWNLVSQYGDLATSAPMILKLGDRGVLYIHGDERIQIPALPVHAVHTTGAGETVAGVFLGLRAQQVSIADALETAAKYASISVTDFGIEHLDQSIPKYLAGEIQG